MERAKYQELLLKGIKAGIVLILLTPLVFGPFGITFSDFPKSIFFKTITEAIFILYLLLVFLNPGYLPKISVLVLSVAIFLVISALSSLMGIHPGQSFWGDLERGGGLILLFHLFIFFLIVINVFKEKKEWFKLFKITVIVSALSSFAGVLQKLGKVSFYRMEPERISGTFTNPDFFAPFILVSIFLGFFLFLIEENKKWKILWVAITVLNCYTLFLAGSRAAWIGLFFGLIFLSPFFFPPFYKKLIFKRRIILLLIILFLSFIILLIVLKPEQFDLGDSKLIKRISSIFTFDLGVRGTLWEMGLEAWKQKPFLGWGMESFGFISEKFLKEKYVPIIGENIYFDRAHNKYVDLLVDFGALGFLSYFAVFAIIFYYLFADKKDRNLKIILAASLIAYLVDNFFSFDTISVYLIFFLVAGFINNNYIISRELVFLKSRQSAAVLAFSLIPLSLFVFYAFNLKPFLAAIVFPAYVKYEADDPQKALSGYRRALDANTVYDKYLRMTAAERAVYMLEKGYAEGKTEEEFIKVLLELKPFLEKDAEIFGRNQGKEYEMLIRTNERIYLFSKDKFFLEEMERTINKAMEFNNQRQELYRLKGELEILRGNYREGEEYFIKAYDMGLKSLDNRIRFHKKLAAAYSKAGEKEKSAENYKEALYMDLAVKKLNPEAFTKTDLSYFSGVALLYCKNLKDSETCREIYEKAIEAFPHLKNALLRQMELYLKTAE